MHDSAVLVHDLCFRYPSGAVGLNHLDLEVAEGERLALLGRNGAGKSTLLLCLNGLLAGRGVIRVLGHDVPGPELKALRQQVGLVFQRPEDQLFMPTVFDEVAYAPLNAGYDDAAVRARVARALDSVGLTGLERRHPANLSLGQQKRLSIATVLATDNLLLALDEPTAGLDPPGVAELLALLQGLPGTLIVATHDLAFAQALCGRAAWVEDGRVVASGPCAEVIAAQQTAEWL